MNTALVIRAEKRELFQKIISDLKYALKDLTTEELLQIFKDASLQSFKTTIKTKRQTLKNAGSFIKNTYVRYKKNGIIESVQSDAERFENFLTSLPGKAKSVYDNFLKLKREEQIEIVAVTIITVAIFFAAGGGLDMEGGIPDTDIALMGIEHHRSFLTHSIFIGLGVEFVGRFSLLTLQRIKNRMPADRHQIWNTVYNYIDKHQEKAIAAMWLGVGTHLLKDSGMLGHGVTPYKDLPISMPMEAHQGLFAANGIASGIFGVKNKKIP